MEIMHNFYHLCNDIATSVISLLTLPNIWHSWISKMLERNRFGTLWNLQLPFPSAVPPDCGLQIWLLRWSSLPAALWHKNESDEKKNRNGKPVQVTVNIWLLWQFSPFFPPWTRLLHGSRLAVVNWIKYDCASKHIFLEAETHHVTQSIISYHCSFKSLLWYIIPNTLWKIFSWESHLGIHLPHVDII